MIRRGGSARPMAPSAARTRSRLSATALSARPTMVKLGSPLLELHLDIDVGRSRPRNARVRTRAMVRVAVERHGALQ